MSRTLIAIASCILVTASPGWATQTDRMQEGAPQAGENARYCLKVEAATGTRLETVQCHTRTQWAELDVDVDKEWAKEGVRVIA